MAVLSLYRNHLQSKQMDGFNVMVTLAWNENVDVCKGKYQPLDTSYCF